MAVQAVVVRPVHLGMGAQELMVAVTMTLRVAPEAEEWPAPVVTVTMAAGVTIMAAAAAERTTTAAAKVAPVAT